MHFTSPLFMTDFSKPNWEQVVFPHPPLDNLIIPTAHFSLLNCHLKEKIYTANPQKRHPLKH